MKDIPAQGFNHVKSVAFQREKGGEWETGIIGIMLNRGYIGIIDSKGELFTEKPWDYREEPGLEIDLEYVQENRDLIDKLFRNIEKMLQVE